MQITAIVIGSILLLISIGQFLVFNNTKNTETQKYNVIKKYEGFEIRKYEASTFSYTTINSNSYKVSSKQGFRKLASFIFGGNNRNQSISMTSPVKMELKDSITMLFMIPSEMGLSDIPNPYDSTIKFKSEPSTIVAAISFGGWANDKRIQQYKNELINLLKENRIDYKQEFSFLGYNPPFELFNRRNEVIVTLQTKL